MMDARIGQVMRAGQIIHYAFANGYDAPPVEGSQEAVEVALGLRIPFSAPVMAASMVPRKATSELHQYIVNVRKKFPAWDEHGGFDHNVSATSKSTAIKHARADMDKDCMFTGSMGPIYYKARLAGEQPELDQ
jgi:hypothetical protein